MDEVPKWLTLQVYACRACAFNRKQLSAVGFSKSGWLSFNKNEMLMTCPICDFTSPKYLQKVDEITGEESVIDMWYPIHLGSQKEFLLTLELVRAPPYRIVIGEYKFRDDKTYGKYYQQGSFNPEDLTEEVIQLG